MLNIRSKATVLFYDIIGQKKKAGCLNLWYNHGVIILNRGNNSMFLHLKIYWNRQVFDLIRASRFPRISKKRRNTGLVPVSQHKNQNKRRKKWRYVYRKFGFTQRFKIEDTKERSQIRVMGVKKIIYIWRDIMKAVTFYF